MMRTGRFVLRAATAQIDEICIGSQTHILATSMIDIKIEFVSDCLHVILRNEHSLRSSKASVSGVRDSISLYNSTYG